MAHNTSESKPDIAMNSRAEPSGNDSTRDVASERISSSAKATGREELVVSKDNRPSYWLKKCSSK